MKDYPLTITIPNASPELIEQAKVAAYRFFQACGVTAWQAADAQFRLESFCEFGCCEFTDADIPASDAWEDVAASVMEACGVSECMVELDHDAAKLAALADSEKRAADA